MKKTISFMMMAAAVCAAASCDLQVETPSAPLTSFTALSEGITRTSLSDSFTVLWTSGNSVGVYSDEVSTPYEFSTTDGGGATASFSGQPTSGTSFYAAYPYVSTSSLDGDLIKSMSLPASQKAVAGSFDNDVAVMVANASTKDFQFKNVCGLIKFTLTRDDVTSITLKSNAGEPLTGTFDVDWNNGVPTVSNVTDATDYVTLSNGGAALAAGDYFFTVLPVSMTGGFTIYTSRSTTDAEQTATAAATVQRSHILDIHNPGAKASFDHRTFEDFEFGGRVKWYAGDGATQAIVSNPAPSGINTSATCLKYTTASEAWDYVYCDSFKDISYSTTGYQVKMDCYAPAAGKKVYLKINGVEVQTCRTTVANAWETLVFNFRSLEAADVESSNIIICADAGGTEAGAVYYFDNIRQTAESGVVSDPDQVRFLGGFEGCGIIRGNGLSGASWGIAANPSPSGINTSATCGVITKSAAGWDGMYTDNFSTSAIDFSKGGVIKMQVYSPQAGQTFQIKFEKGSDTAYRNVYANAVTTKSNEWEELVFDFGNCFQSNSATKGTLAVTAFKKFVIYAYGGNTSASGTKIYVDNIRQCKGFADLTATRCWGGFEYPGLTFNNLDNGQCSVVDNPSPDAVNPTAKCSKIIKAAQNYSGVWASPFDRFNFSRDGYKLKLHVYSPVAGRNFYLKLEGDKGVVKPEVIVACTKANQWEELVFDYSSKSVSDDTYYKFVLYPGGGQAESETYYVDNLRQCK